MERPFVLNIQRQVLVTGSQVPSQSLNSGLCALTSTLHALAALQVALALPANQVFQADVGPAEARK